MDAERFGHQVSRYERPNFPYRCGRAALWGKPCARGPLSNGKCGGVSECQPYFNGKGYECRRSPAAGGPCDQGPLPDGNCSIQRPPCVPRRPLRFLRRRATYLAVLISLVALIGFSGGGNTLGMIAERLMAPAVSSEEAGEPVMAQHTGFSLLDPGPLTGAHARFTEKSGCVSCHSGVGKGPRDWLQAAVTGHDMTKACTECHLFSGPPDSPHNLEQTAANGVEALQCTFCHSEHKGADFDIAAIADDRCHACHEPALKFTSFSVDHPPFGADYPHRAPTAIKFDHNKHMGEHFVNPRYKEQAPEACHSCHDLSRADLKVPTLGYQAMCADCHADAISNRTLTLVTQPYSETSPLTFAELDPESEAPSAEEVGVSAEDLLAACGTDYDVLAELEERLEAMAAEAEADSDEESLLEDGEEVLAEEQEEDEEDFEDEEFESEAQDDPTVMDAFLLEIDPDDEEDYWGPYRSLMLRMAVRGAAPLADLLDARLGQGAAKSHLAALDDDFVRAFGCAWAANEEFDPEALETAEDEAEEPVAPYWTSDGFTLQYVPAHGDPAIKDWLTHLLRPGPAMQDADEELVEELREIFLPETGDGVGACATCHWLDSGGLAAPESEGAATQNGLIWRDRPASRGSVLYTHVPHINLLGRGTWCQNCHQLDNSASYGANFQAGEGASYVSNFKPIDVGTCGDCHRAEAGVRQDCLTCHEYHREPTIRERMQSHEAKLQPEN